MSKNNRMSALGPYLRAQLASEEAFDNAGGVRFDDEPGPLPLDRQPAKSFNQPTVLTVARAPAPVVPVPVTPFVYKRHAEYIASAVKDCENTIRDMAHINRKGKAAFGKVI